VKIIDYIVHIDNYKMFFFVNVCNPQLLFIIYISWPLQEGYRFHSIAPN